MSLNKEAAGGGSLNKTAFFMEYDSTLDRYTLSATMNGTEVSVELT